MRTRPGFAVVCLLAGACYSSAGENADAGDADASHESIGDTAPDDAAAEDGTSDVPCTAPEHRVRATTEILELSALGDGPAAVGRVVRLLARVDTGGPGCGAFAGVEVETDAAAHLARVTVWVWSIQDALAGACGPHPDELVVVNLFGLTAGTWTIQDATPGPAGDPVTLTLEVEACDAECSCLGPAENRPAGTECTLDCQCEGGLSCIGFYGIDGLVRHACERSCTDDDDCPQGSGCSDWDDGPSRICSDGIPPASCTPPGDCGVGRSCLCDPTSGGCLCTVVEARAPDRPCCRSEDCPEGHACLVDDGGASVCGVPCRHDFACGGFPMSCDHPPDGPGVCFEWSE